MVKVPQPSETLPPPYGGSPIGSETEEGTAVGREERSQTDAPVRRHARASGRRSLSDWRDETATPFALFGARTRGERSPCYVHPPGITGSVDAVVGLLTCMWWYRINLMQSRLTSQLPRPSNNATHGCSRSRTAAHGCRHVPCAMRKDCSPHLSQRAVTTQQHTTPQRCQRSKRRRLVGAYVYGSASVRHAPSQQRPSSSPLMLSLEAVRKIETGA
jgi:hypothetical protein